MRAYFFGNMYLSSIQQGIQAAHVVAEMFIRKLDWSQEIYLTEWARNHKTMILLNAGYSDNIRTLVEFFRSENNPYPWASFNEGQDALDGALTCAGIILPEKIYGLSKYQVDWDNLRLTRRFEVKSFEHTVETWDYNDWELDLATKLQTFGLAR